MGVSGKVFLIVAFVALAFNLSGCAQPIGATRFPEPSVTFVPKKEYAAPFENVWNTVHDVLENNRIAVAAESKDEGRITTDYVQGESQMHAFGFLGVLSSRYKYVIRLSRTGVASTRINILAYLESSGSAGPPEGGAVGGAWRDVSNDNKAGVTKLENWLYEQIQTAIEKR
jgi:NlpB/DapX lipoprotein